MPSVETEDKSFAFISRPPSRLWRRRARRALTPLAVNAPRSGAIGFMAKQPLEKQPLVATPPKVAWTTPLWGGSLCNFCMVVREKVVPTLRVGTVSFITIELPYYLRSI